MEGEEGRRREGGGASTWRWRRRSDGVGIGAGGGRTSLRLARGAELHDEVRRPLF